jgi:hypothetical protein
VSVDRPLDGDRVVSVNLQVQGIGSVAELAGALGELDGVVGVTAGDVNEDSNPE